MNVSAGLIVVLLVLTALNCLAIVALVRQVGVLHLRLQPVGARATEDGPTRGTTLGFLTDIPDPADGARSILFGFFSPTCELCGPLLPAFGTLARSGESVVLVTDAERERGVQYLSRKGIDLPLIADGDALTRNRVPGTPYAVVTDRSLRVQTAGVVNSLEQIESLVEEARSADSGEHAAASAVSMYTDETPKEVSDAS